MDSTPKFLRIKYEKVEFIARGAYGRVYKCVRSGKTTAVKVLDALDPAARTRFKGEVDILRRVDHENIVKVLDAGETDGHYWYESEYASQGHFGIMASYLFYSDADRVKYFRQICLGVQALHELDPPIIHRDLKPSNILVFEYLEPQRHVVLKVADFGIAAIAGEASSLTTTGTALGTAHYMAPERSKNPRVKTPQSDIYSLGITFLEACTGYTIPSQENLDLVPDVLRPIVSKMVRQSPGERYQSVAEVIEAFNNLSFHRLQFGTESQGNVRGTTIFRVNIGRELENVLETLNRCDSENVLDRLKVFERTLDRLGAARDHEAHTISNISAVAMATIDEADREALVRLIQRFDDAASMTTEQDWYLPSPDQWSKFLADAFEASSYRATKHLCLEILVKVLVRFGSPWTKNYFYLTITKIEDPSYMEYLAERLREVGREDIAVLLDGVPDERDLDLDALRSTLRGAEQISVQTKLDSLALEEEPFYETPEYDLTPRVVQPMNESISVTEAKNQSIETAVPTPNIRCLSAYPHTVMRTSAHEEKSHFIFAETPYDAELGVIAVFGHESKDKLPLSTLYDVKARIYYYDFRSKRLVYKVRRGFWLSHTYDSVLFSADAVRRLLVCIVDGLNVKVLEHRCESHSMCFAAIEETLSDVGGLDIEVFLVAGSHEEPIKGYKFELRILSENALPLFQFMGEVEPRLLS